MLTQLSKIIYMAFHRPETIRTLVSTGTFLLIACGFMMVDTVQLLLKQSTLLNWLTLAYLTGFFCLGGWQLLRAWRERPRP